MTSVARGVAALAAGLMNEGGRRDRRRRRRRKQREGDAGGGGGRSRVNTCCTPVTGNEDSCRKRSNPPTAPSCSRGTRGARGVFGSFSAAGMLPGLVGGIFSGSAGRMTDRGRVCIASLDFTLDEIRSSPPKKRSKPMLLSLGNNAAVFARLLDGTPRLRVSVGRARHGQTTSWAPAPVRTSP